LIENQFTLNKYNSFEEIMTGISKINELLEYKGIA